MTKAKRRFRPALDTLTKDQREVLKDLEAGFETREDVIRWCQRVIVRSLGQLDDGFFVAVTTRPDVLDWMTGRVEGSQTKRGLLYDRRIQPALDSAYHQLRDSAHEYLDRDDSPLDDDMASLDPEAQEYIAMRPSLTELDAEQQEALDRAFSGFESRSEVRDWVLLCRDATEGQLPEHFGNWCCYEPAAYNALVGAHGKRESRIARESIIAERLLPAFNAGVRDLHGEAGEQPEKETAAVKPTRGF